MELKDIKFDKHNYRKHSAENQKLIKKSLEETGFGRSVLIDSENCLIAGNGVVSQLPKNTKIKVVETDGTEMVVVKRTDLKTADRKRKELARNDNATANNVEWEQEELKQDFSLDELKAWGIEELPAIETELEEVKEDEVPEQVETKCKRGDIWQLGEHRLMCGDSTVITDVEKLMNGEKADMVFTDPPYNVAYEGKTKDKLTIQNDKFDTDEKAAEELWYPAFSNMKIVSQPNASFYMTMPQGGTHMMMMMMMKSGWQVKHELIWKKQSIVLNRADYNYQHEPILFGWNEKHIFYGKGKYKNTSVWEFDRPTKSKEHPTMKPIELIAEALLNSSKENDLVIDLFGGSGSTLIACEQLYRKCRMMELDEHYCDVIIQRWENLTGKKAVLCK